jgi:hypothetical protein
MNLFTIVLDPIPDVEVISNDDAREAAFRCSHPIAETIAVLLIKSIRGMNRPKIGGANGVSSFYGARRKIRGANGVNSFYGARRKINELTPFSSGAGTSGWFPTRAHFRVSGG